VRQLAIPVSSLKTHGAPNGADPFPGLKEGVSSAGERSIKLAIEPLNRFETDLVNTIDQGMKMVDDVGQENVGLLLDTFHMNLEKKNIPAAIGRAAGKIVEFHACSNARNAEGGSLALEGDRRSPKGFAL
jgi:sugar phosphate isomerase/epimerase